MEATINRAPVLAQPLTGAVDLTRGITQTPVTPAGPPMTPGPYARTAPRGTVAESMHGTAENRAPGDNEGSGGSGHSARRLPRRGG